MLAGDYLSYKGDWATNTAYNVNDCVTWTDGHLYEVIKAHTSSSTIDPSNTEYYKAMTASKAEKIILKYNDILTPELITKLTDAQDEGRQIKVKLPVPNQPIVITPSVDALYIYGYTTLVDSEYNGFSEYILAGKRNSRVRAYYRNVSLSNPSSAPAYSETSLDGDITFIISL